MKVRSVQGEFRVDVAGRLSGRSCLIVGGTSGIGLASARRFLREGARVVVTGRTSEDAHEALALLEGTGPVWALPADVSDPHALSDAFRAAVQLLSGRLDVLFHHAGMSGRKHGDGDLHECSVAAWDAVTDANARAVFVTNQAAVRVMLAQGPDSSGVRGAVLNTGSVIDISPSPVLFGTYAYSASKGAVRAMTLAAAARYAPEGVRFNLLAPAVTDTPMASRALADPRTRAYLAGKLPLARGPVHPADCAEAALFLCEPASRFITGVELAVDAGWRVTEAQVPPAGAAP